MSEVKNKDFSNKKIWTVKPDYVLVCNNKLTKRQYVKGEGIHINLPFVESKLVNIASKLIGSEDNDKITNKCLDGFDVTINPSISVKVVDAKKYLYASLNPEAELNVKLQQVILKLIARNHYVNLSAIEIRLDDPKFAYIKKEFSGIEEKFGLRLEKIYIQSVEISQSMKDDFEKTEMQKKENQRMIAEAETKKKIAQFEREAEYTKLSAFNDSVIDLAVKLRKHGFSDSLIESELNYLIGTRRENSTNILNLGNSNTRNVSSAAITGAVLKKTK